ncbi:MAG: class II fructose-bisphosphate aldolase [Candidatus Levybacteria bacterium]|nr:class II fructose-bisphosphate aldolase [Candidatus Levybacteria bacterium]
MLTLEELNHEIDGVLSLSPTKILDQEKLQSRLIDILIYQAHLAEEDVATISLDLIFELARLTDVVPSSIRPLYQAIARDEINGFCVPAFNIRTLTYDTAQVAFRLMMKHDILPVVFELARSEMKYTDQPPRLYSATILAAAIKQGYKGPVFIQGDHFQVNAEEFTSDKEAEIESLKNLIKDSLDSQILNIDIDASTLVDLSKTNLSEQQRENASVTNELTMYIRSLPNGDRVSIGAEIGHIGDRNSTTDDLRAFVGQLENVQELSKISVQTGTSHGGTVLPDGSLKEVSVDFTVLEKVGKLARDAYGLGGAVQHGASTLPTKLLSRFVEARTLEIHLATHTQTIIFDHLPENVLQKIEAWISENVRDKRKPNETDEQFLYKNRKYALKHFKKTIWDLNGPEKDIITQALESYFNEIFTDLSLLGTRDQTLPYFS